MLMEIDCTMMAIFQIGSQVTRVIFSIRFTQGMFIEGVPQPLPAPLAAGRKSSGTARLEDL